MGNWGTGIKQSDEFGEVYDLFFDRYVGDAEPRQLAKKIWAEYSEELQGTDAFCSALYTVRYALAQCLWECGVRDDTLWTEIKNIIDSDKDLEAWKELGADDRLLKSRRKNLYAFWDKINTVTDKPRKPRKQTTPRKPTLLKGDIFAYAVGEDGYRACIVFDYVWNLFLVAITDPVFPSIPNVSDVWESKTKLVFWSEAKHVVPKKNRISLDHVSIPGDYNGRAGLIYSEKGIELSSISEREYYYDPVKAEACMRRNGIGTYTMKALLDPAVLPLYLPNREQLESEFRRFMGSENDGLEV